MREGVAVSGIRAVVFDVGRVLLHWEPALLYGPMLGGPEDVQAFLDEVDFHGLNQRLDRGEPWEATFAEACARFPHRAEALNAYRDRWDVTIPGPLEDTVALLEELHGRVPLYALTNFGSRSWPVVRARYAFFDRFDGIVASCEEGLIKPDPAIYRRLLDRYGLEAAATFFTDDLEANVQAARAVGLRAHRFMGAAILRRELEAHGLL